MLAKCKLKWQSNASFKYFNLTAHSFYNRMQLVRSVSQVTWDKRQRPIIRSGKRILSEAYVKPMNDQKRTQDPISSKETQHQLILENLQSDPKSVEPTIILDLIASSSNPLRQLSPNINLCIFYTLQSHQVCAKFTKSDWHRLLENTMGQVNFLDPISSEMCTGILEMFKEMKHSGIYPDAYVFSSLYKAVSDDAQKIIGVHEHVRKLLGEDQLRKPAVISNKSVQTLLQIMSVKHPNVKTTYLLPEIWDDMKMTKIQPTVDTCLALLHSKSISEYEDLVSDIHAHLKWRKSVLKESWTAKVYEALMNVHITMKHFKATEKLFIEMQQNGLTGTRYVICTRLNYRSSFTSYLKALKGQNLTAPILDGYKMMKLLPVSIFEDDSLQIILDAAQISKKDEIPKKLFYLAQESIKKGSAAITWRILADFVRVFSVAKEKDLSVSAFQLYKDHRALASEKHNRDRNLVRPRTIFEEPLTGKVSLPSLHYMPPEVPRSVLFHMAYLFGYSMDKQKIITFFESEVLDRERLLLYRTRYLNGINKTSQEMIEKSQARLGSIKTKADRQELKDEITKQRRRIKRSKEITDAGMHGPIESVYKGLLSGWQERSLSLQQDQQAASLMELEDLIFEIIEKERHVGGSL